MTDQDVTLPDGRLVSLAEYGDPDGRPVFHLHGAGSCRGEAKPFDAAALKRGVRIIAPDRPGMGRSTDLPGRTMLGYADDLAAIADALGVGAFAVGGVSNGGAFAMATAHALGDRVTRVLPMNPTTPIADPRVKADLGLRGRLGYATMARMLRKGKTPGPPQLPTGRLARLNADYALLHSPEGIDWFEARREAFRGEDYLVTEMTLGCRPWGFDHRAVSQPVEFLSGAKDAGLSYARVWVSELPDARLHVFPGGHSGFLGSEALTMITDSMAAG